MTSFAFILGVVPLVIATGAGAEMRRSLGIAVFAGMLGVTLFGIFLTPVFYYVIQYFGGRRAAPPRRAGNRHSDQSGTAWLVIVRVSHTWSGRRCRVGRRGSGFRS